MGGDFLDPSQWFDEGEAPPYAVVIDGEMAVDFSCALDYYADLNPAEPTPEFEWVGADGYPDGYTCALCGTVVQPEKNL